MLFCRPHWRITPYKLKRWVWATYRRGQEIDKRPSEEYMRAQRAAIRAVENAEFKPDESNPDWFHRASGDCICPDCGLAYYDHPESVHYPYLNVLCDRSFVKL